MKREMLDVKMRTTVGFDNAVQYSSTQCVALTACSFSMICKKDSQEEEEVPLTAMSFCVTPTTCLTVLKACRMINSKKQDLISSPANVNCQTRKASETNPCLAFGDHKNEQKMHN